MRQILFRLIGILEVAGGFYGMAIVLPRLLAFGPLRMAAFGLIEFAIYAFVLVAGVLLLENSERGIRFSSVAQLLQLPLIATPIFSYALHCGACIDLYAALHFPTRPELTWAFGSQRFALEFHGPGVPRLGVNVLALLSWLVLKLR
ncbi:hypothetical protein [Dyella mobilis]|uniref:DUF4149 domain-containing protein n=1 Tax=Dyella mobilis TaxID=1849582 RepID=A0ABS2KFN9_9GAMM|nr:hypothetical protein [Dyella mobilis]MBM7129188.1 hypothetical protein [Dyella mobilis]GLQ98482.1 hypothetical protein GCM10007863_29020 [Dyella mobilis]